jgi:hypothetical protein
MLKAIGKAVAFLFCWYPGVLARIPVKMDKRIKKMAL